MITAAIQTTLTPGDYWMAFMTVTKTTNANWATGSNMVWNAGNTVFSGPLGVAQNNSFQPELGFGMFSVQTAAIPNSMAFADIQGAAAAVFRSTPQINLVNGTA